MTAPGGPAGLPRAQRFDVVLVGATVLTAFLIPARLVVPGLGAEGRPTTVLAIGLLLVWVLRAIRGTKEPTASGPLRTLLMIQWVVILWAYALGHDRGLTAVEATAQDRALLVWLGASGLMLAVAEAPRSLKALDRILQSAVWGAVAMSVLGVLQGFGLNLVQYIRVPGLVFNAPIIGVSERGEGLARVAGTASHYIEYGAVAALVLPLALHYWGNDRRTGGTLVNRWSIAAGLILAAVPFSLSRTGVLVLLAVLAVYAVSWSGRTLLNGAVLAVMTIVAFQAVRPGTVGTLRGLFTNFSSDPSVTARTDDYPIVAAYITERPLLGRGPGTFLPSQYLVLDNQVLMTLLTVGTLGLLSLAALLIGAAIVLGRVSRRRRLPEHRSLSAALTAAIVGAVVAFFTFDALSFVAFSTVLWLVVGAAFALFRLTAEPLTVALPPPTPQRIPDRVLGRPGVPRGTLPEIPPGWRVYRPTGADDLEPALSNVDVLADDVRETVPKAVPPPTARRDRSARREWLMPLDAGLSLRTTMARGARASGAAGGVRLVLQITSTVILFRILGPEAFGIVGMALAVTALADLLREAGLANAVITRKVVTQAQVSALFWVNTAVGLALAGAVVLLGWPLAWFYGEPHVQPVMAGLSLVYVFSGIGVQHQALLLRSMQFHAVAVRDALAQAAGVAVAIALALAGAGLWSLVALYVVVAATRTVTAWSVCSWRPSAPTRHVDGLRDLLAFGGNVSGFQLLNYAARNADNILIGRFVGAQALGLYGRAYSLVLVPFQQITQPVGPPTMAALARLRGDPVRFRAAYGRVVGIMSLIGLPLVATMVVLADPAVGLVLGPEGEPATPIFQALAVAGAAQIVSATAGWLYLVTDRTRAMLRWALFSRPLVVSAFVAGLPWGATGVAIAYAAVTTFLLPLGMINATRGTAVRPWDWVRATAWPAFAATVTGACAYGAELLAWSAGDVARTVAGAGGALVALTGCVLVVPSLRRRVTELRVALRRRRRRRPVDSPAQPGTTEFAPVVPEARSEAADAAPPTMTLVAERRRA